MSQTKENLTSGGSSSKIKESPISPYFQSSTHELLFYLLELDGEARMEKLGITARLFFKKAEAKKWYRELAKQIHPDTCHLPQATRGMEVLNHLYAQLLGED